MRRPDLVPDCGSCAAICCVATSFDASEDFAIDKAAGVACPHLAGDGRCGIHAELVERGFRGCAAFDCYGAGPRATRELPEEERLEGFLRLLEVHELLWLLTEAAQLCPDAALRGETDREVAALDAGARPDRARVQAILRRVGAAIRPRLRVVR